MIKNFLKMTQLLVTGSLKDVASYAKSAQKEVSDIAYSLRNQMLVFAIALPMILVSTGLVLGAHADTVADEASARKWIATGVLVNVLALALLLARKSFYAAIIIAVGRGTNNAFALSILPDAETTKKHLRTICAVMAWVTGVSLWQMAVPMYRSYTATIFASVAMVAIAYTMISERITTRYGWHFLYAFLIIAIAVPTARMTSPTIASALDKYSTRVFGTNGDTDQDRILIAQFESEISDIQMAAATKCKGHYCSKDDRAKVADLTEKLSLLRTGQYWTAVNEEGVIEAEAHKAEATETKKKETMWKESAEETNEGSEDTTATADVEEENLGVAKPVPPIPAAAVEVSRPTQRTASVNNAFAPLDGL